MRAILSSPDHCVLVALDTPHRPCPSSLSNILSVDGDAPHRHRLIFEDRLDALQAKGDTVPRSLDVRLLDGPQRREEVGFLLAQECGDLNPFRVRQLTLLVGDKTAHLEVDRLRQVARIRAVHDVHADIGPPFGAMGDGEQDIVSLM